MGGGKRLLERENFYYKRLVTCFTGTERSFLVLFYGSWVTYSLILGCLLALIDQPRFCTLY